MGYWINLYDLATGELVEFEEPHNIAGGTYAVGGTREATLSVTYNYSRCYGHLFPNEEGIKWLEGKTGAESIPVLESIIDQLKDDFDYNDYWHATEGNAKLALLGLLTFAKAAPDGYWEVH